MVGAQGVGSRIEQHHAVAAFVLGLVGGGIGRGQQRRPVPAVEGVHRDADRRGDIGYHAVARHFQTVVMHGIEQHGGGGLRILAQ